MKPDETFWQRFLATYRFRRNFGRERWWSSFWGAIRAAWRDRPDKDSRGWEGMVAHDKFDALVLEFNLEGLLGATGASLMYAGYPYDPFAPDAPKS